MGTDILDRILQMQDHWSMRLLRQCRGNQTLTGCIVIAVLGKAASNPPRFIFPTAAIGIDGRMYCPFEHRDGTKEALFSPGHVVEVRDDLRRLADHCRLDDTERTQFFDEVRKWIARDERAIKSSVI